MDVFWAAPPISRTLTALALVESVLIHAGILNPRLIIFYAPRLLTWFPEIWRLVTPFLLTGPGFQMFYDLYFLYTYSSQLEVNSSRFNQPGDFFVYVVFLFAVILATAGFYLQEYVFLPALILGFVYTWSQENRGRRVTLFIVQLPAEWLPYAMLLLSLATGRWHSVLSQATGLIAAHLYEFLTRIYPEFGGGRNYLVTPAFIRQAFAGASGPRAKSYGTAYPAAGQTRPSSTSSGSAWTSSWSRMGPGRRLGGD
ncbi:hypothetical protein VTN49DRAFT_1489 [Thermomyces lanuginosus]|uniref:uncharacterized protein n=1 Tax=Thermomyces lanuginosus TaxID=5541 RepID=UPI003744664E